MSPAEIRSRIAEKRAKGANTAITEDEENLLVDALQQMRENESLTQGASFAHQSPTSAPHSISSFGGSSIRQSAQSTSSSLTHSILSFTDSPGGRSSKRHSNNLFAGQFRELQYIRKARDRQGSNRSLLSGSQSDTSDGITSAYAYQDNIRPSTPENTASSTSNTSSPEEKTGIRSAPLQGSLPFDQSSSSVVPLHFSRALSQKQLKRLSTSLEEVIRELEEEQEDQVLVPRSGPSRSASNGSAGLTFNVNVTLGLILHNTDSVLAGHAR